MIYLDNAATTLHKPPQVAEAVCRALGTLGNSARGAHSGAMDASRTVYAAREKLAALLGCRRSDHVVFTANVTQALNIALYGLLRPGDRAVATDWSHNSSLRPLYRLRDEGDVALDFVPADRRGRLDAAAFDAVITPGTKLVMLTHASNLTGDLLDVGRVAALAHERGALVVLDAAQTAGARTVDMEALGADVLCFTGHKGLYGPQGTGGLCVREGVDIRPLLVGGTGVQTYSPAQPEQYPTRLEAGTHNVPGIAGLEAGLRYVRGMTPERIAGHERRLIRRAAQGLRRLDGVRVYAAEDAAKQLGVLSFTVDGREPEDVAHALAARGVAVHCAPLAHRSAGTAERGTVRVSVSAFSTEAEIDGFLRELRGILAK